MIVKYNVIVNYSSLTDINKRKEEINRKLSKIINHNIGVGRIVKR